MSEKDDYTEGYREGYKAGYTAGRNDEKDSKWQMLTELQREKDKKHEDKMHG
jgi:flagellar biosynthesis/type III secretory pathway protein FliH